MIAKPFETVRVVPRDARPLVVHVIHRFATGGLENGLVNLINRMPPQACRHAVLAMTEITDFSQRLQRDDVGLYAMHKAPGHGVKLYPRLVALLRELKPAVLHTRNLGPLEMQPAAALAGVGWRVHGEHGRELNDLDGDNRKLQWVRRAYTPFVSRYIALSRDLQDYLIGRVGVAPRRIAQVYNGVDGQRFHPGSQGPEPVPGCPFDPSRHWLVGTVGRMQGVKHQVLLARAFVRACALSPALRASGRLVLIGDGPLRAECQGILAQAGLTDLSWLPGERHDVPEVLRGLSCFVLPSLAEGISNTILEAMATGIPVIASAVGGNVELVEDRRTGLLVAPDDVEALATAMVALHSDADRARAMGRAGRQDVDQRFSMEAMVSAYMQVYAPGIGHTPTNAPRNAQTGR
jgi:sugar transferase (PEP-CTERM/EpsH1 system associated)